MMETYHYIGIGIIVVAILLRWRLKVDLRLPFLVAVLLLGIVAIMIASGDATQANDIAMVAYYCLLGGIFLLIAEMLWKEWRGKDVDGPFWGDLPALLRKIGARLRRKTVP